MKIGLGIAVGLVLLFLGLWLSSTCGGDDNGTDTASAQNTETPTATPTANPSATPSPTPTNAPSATPTPNADKARLIEDIEEATAKVKDSDLKDALEGVLEEVEDATDSEVASGKAAWTSFVTLVVLVDQKLTAATGDMKRQLEDLREQIKQAADDDQVQANKAGWETIITVLKSPGPDTTVTPPSGGQVTMTKCGPVEWGPAGQPPGVGTSDSGKQVMEAISVMQVPEASKPFVTIHKFCPGDDTPNGWIIGSSWTESQRIQVTAGFLPAGVCIDYDPHVTKITGEILHTEVRGPLWSRSILKSNGSLTGLKATAYWTPCVFNDGFVVKPGDIDAPTTAATPGASSASFSCSALPQSAADLVEVFPDSKNGKWTQDPKYNYGWVYNGPTITLTVVDGVDHIDYDGRGSIGRATAGQTTLPGIVFTVWFCP